LGKKSGRADDTIGAHVVISDLAKSATTTEARKSVFGERKKRSSGLDGSER